MWEQIRSNQTRSAILVVLMGALLLLIGYFLGLYFFDSGIGGLIFAIVLWVIMSLVAYFQGDSILLAMSRARKISHDDHPLIDKDTVLTQKRHPVCHRTQGNQIEEFF